MKRLIQLTLSFLLIFAMAACQAQPEKKPQEQPKSEKQVRVDLDLAEQAKKVALSVPGVEDATSVVLEQTISTGIKVSGFDRLRLKSIKEEVHQKTKELAQDYEVDVTSDKKLFKGIQDIEKDLVQKGQTTAPEAVYKKIEKIDEDMKG